MDSSDEVSFKCFTLDVGHAKLNVTEVVLFKCDDKEAVNYEIYRDKTQRHKIVAPETPGLKRVVVSVGCPNKNKSLILIELRLLAEIGFFRTQKNFDSVSASITLLVSNESCIYDEEDNYLVKKAKSIDANADFLPTVKSKIYESVKIASSALLSIVVFLALGLLIVFLVFRQKSKPDDQLSIVDSRQRHVDWSNKNMSMSSNTIETNGEFSTIRSKHSLREDYSYSGADEGLQVNDRPNVNDGLFAFSDGYLNEMGIDMMDNLRSIAMNTNFVPTVKPHDELKFESVHFASDMSAASMIANEKFVYMDVGFYKWCKLLDWKLEYKDLSSVFEDLAKLE